MLFLLYDRWGNQVGTVLGVISAKRHAVVNGDRYLKLVTLSRMEKGQRVLFRDRTLAWREWIVSEVVETREEKGVVSTVTCDDSIAELNGDYLVEKGPKGTADVCLASALSTSRWQVGTVDVTGTQLCDFYHISAREAVNDVAEKFGAEISTTITVDDYGVVSRKVNLTKRVGSDNGKRFTYGKDLVSIERTVESADVVTALYGYGKGVEKTDENGNATGGYSRKITFGDINGGLDYVTDSTALQTWGRPDGSGGKVHVFGIFEDSDCEDKATLLAETKAALAKRCVPQLSYTAKVIDLRAAGYEAEGVMEGDGVDIVDTSFDPPLRCTGRVLEIEEDYMAPEDTEVTLGNIQETIDGTLATQLAALKGLRDHSASWDGAASISTSYINAVINQLNEALNATGGYVYMEPGEGIYVYDKPIDQSPTQVIWIGGGAFRIADSKKSTGEWDWRTFGTGAGFTADEITAGVIQGGANTWNLETGDVLFRQGGIRDSANKNFWNLTTGDFQLSSAATIGGKTAAKIASDAVDAQTQQMVFNKLTNNGQTQGIYLSNGLLYINGTYLKVGTITDGVGRNSWNLTTGALTTNYMTANNIDADGTFKCGSTSNLLTVAGGSVTGTASGSTRGHIHFNGATRDTTTGVTYYGMQLTGNQMIRETTPRYAVANSANEGDVATWCVSGSFPIAFYRGSQVYTGSVIVKNGRIVAWPS
jgi:phage minor structural protein